jgi:hypothetical protein
MSEFAVPDDAVAALDAAIVSDAGDVAGDATPTGFDPGNTGTPAPGLTQGDQDPNAATPTDGQQAPVAPALDAGQQAPVAPDAGAPVEDSFTDRFDPNSLPPELQAAYKLMQADYTRKRQADAEALRRMAQYEGVDLDTAAALLTRVGNPDGLAQFIAEASEYLVNEGYAEFDGGAADPTAPQAPAAPGQDNLSQALAQLGDDPELAPIAQQLQAMQQQLDGFRSESEQRLAAEREQVNQMRVLGELQRMENVIVTDNPHYKQDDIDAIYRISSFYDGDLLQAQAAYEADFARRLGGYLARKEGAPAPAVPTGLPTPQAVDTPDFNPLDPKQAHQAALDLLKLIESQPE